MLEIGQGPVSGNGFYPEGDAGELDGRRVEVDSEEASFGDPAFAPRARFGIRRPGVLIRGAPVRVPALAGRTPEIPGRTAVPLLNVSAMKGLAEKTHGLDEKMGAPAGGVEDSEAFDLGGGLVFDQRSQGMPDQVANEGPHSVERAGAFLGRSRDEMKHPGL